MSSRHVERNQIQYDRDSFEAILAQYPTPAELDQIRAQDTALYLAALEQAGVPRDIPDPVSAVYFDFERRLTLARAAAELGVTASYLRSHLVDLDPPLQILALPDACIARSDFIAVCRNALCLLLEGAQNRPEACSAGL